MIRHRRKSAAVAAAAFATVLALADAAAFAQLRSFGTAEGFGAVASGGRVAGTVYHVTNLNDSGAGSFRDAVSASNRIVVFDVGGAINLLSAVSAKSNLTILGQTAPGEGVSLNGYETSFANSSNVVVRYLRFRPGDNSPGSDDGVSLYRAHDVMLDHVSIEFGKYNNIDAVDDSGGSPQVTIQHSIIADPISNGNSNTGQGFGAHLEAVKGNYTLSNNLWASSHNRNPLAKVNDQFKNNVEYNNEAGYTTHTSTPFKHDLVNNAFIYGPASGGNTDYYQLSDGDKFYATGNVQDANLNGQFDGAISNPTTGTILTTPNFATTLSLPTLSVSDAYAYVTAHAGASLTRDELDRLVISQVRTLGQGTAGGGVGTTGPDGLYQHASSTGLANGGLGVTLAGSRAANYDSDKDGIADAWEAAHGLSSSDATDSLKLNPLGFRMVEQYANEVGDDNAKVSSTGASGSYASGAVWQSGAAPGVYDNATIRGNGGATGATVTVAAGQTAVAMTLRVGNNSTAGDVVTVSGGALSVYDAITLGDTANATLNVGGGTVSAYTIQLGNTTFGATTSSVAGTINLSGGTLSVAQIALGAGAPGAWTGGGNVNFTGGTLRAADDAAINAPIAITGAGGTIDTAGFDMAVSGTLSGAGAVTKNGTGTLTLSGTNTLTGGVKVNAGALSLNSASGAGAGSVTLANNTTLNLGVSVATPIVVTKLATLTGGNVSSNGPISGTSAATLAVTTATTGNLTFASDLSGFAGTFDFAGSTGNVRLNSAGANGSALATFAFGDGTATFRTVGASTVNLGALSGTAATIQGASNNAGAVTYVVGALGTTTSFTGTIADGAFVGSTTSLTKSGAGTLTLGNANTYTGVTTLRGGTLGVAALASGGAASAIGDSASDAANLVFDGGTLQYTGGAVTIDRNFTVTQNGGRLERNGAGNLVLGSTLDAATTGAGDRTFTLAGDSTSANSFAPGLADPAGGGRTGLAKAGVGTWRLAGNAKTYGGDTTVNGGTLVLLAALPNGAGKGNVTVAAGATLDLYGASWTINGLNGAGTVTTTINSARTLVLGAGDASGDFAGTLAQGASQTLLLSKIGLGTQTLSGTNSYAGATTVSAGKLIVNGSIANSTATVQSGATLGGRGLVGALTANVGSTVAPGNSIDSMEVGGNATLRGTLAIELDGTGAGASDLLSVGGTLDVAGGTLSLTSLTTPNDSAYVIATYATRVGTFATVTGLPAGYAINYAYNDGTGANHIALVATSAVPEPAMLAALVAPAALMMRRRSR